MFRAASKEAITPKAAHARAEGSRFSLGRLIAAGMYAAIPYGGLLLFITHSGVVENLNKIDPGASGGAMIALALAWGITTGIIYRVLDGPQKPAQGA